MMKFTTPVMASEPYTAEAPPVSNSTRWISGAGIWFKSAAALKALSIQRLKILSGLPQPPPGDFVDLLR